MLSNSETFFSLFLMLFISFIVVSTEQVNVIFMNQGNNVTLPCVGKPEGASVMWTHHGSINEPHSDSEQTTDGSLMLSFLEVFDSGIYSCLYDDILKHNNTRISKVNLTVRTNPPALVNVTVHPSTILAVILWNVGGDGGHPIIDFTAEYRAAAINVTTGELEDWKPISPNHISPNSRQIDVYHLVPNASYWFRVWANNILGCGPPVKVLAQTLYIDEDAELVRHFLTGIEGFDVRAWMAAVGVVMGTLAVLALGTCLLLCQDWRRHDGHGYQEDEDVIELVPNITLNPGFRETQGREVHSYAATIIRDDQLSSKGSNEPRKV